MNNDRADRTIVLTGQRRQCSVVETYQKSEPAPASAPTA